MLEGTVQRCLTKLLQQIMKCASTPAIHARGRRGLRLYEPPPQPSWHLRAVNIDPRRIENDEQVKEMVRVHIGFGAGTTMLTVSGNFAARLRVAEDRPPLGLHALTAGFNVREPGTAPVAFFNTFMGSSDISLRPVRAVSVKLWPQTQQLVGVRESIRACDELDIVVTALVSRDDEHGELNRLMNADPQVGAETLLALDEAYGRVGGRACVFH